MTSGIQGLWQADHLRITAFSASPWAPVKQIFHDALGVEAEVVTERRPTGEASASGSCEDFRAEVKTQLNRLDFLITAGGSDEPGTRLLEQIPTRLAGISQRAGQWLCTSGNGITRLAVGCNCLLPAADRSAAYKAIRNLVRVITVDVDRFNDFVFQVNLPVNSKLMPTLRINRVTVWASLISKQIFVQQSPVQQSLAQESHFSNCQLDINTDPAWAESFEAKAIPLLLNELTECAREVLHRGIE